MLQYRTKKRTCARALGAHKDKDQMPKWRKSSVVMFLPSVETRERDQIWSPHLAVGGLAVWMEKTEVRQEEVTSWLEGKKCGVVVVSDALKFKCLYEELMICL